MTTAEMREKLFQVRELGIGVYHRDSDAKCLGTAVIDLAYVVESLLPPEAEEETARLILGTETAVEERDAVLAFLDSIKTNADAGQVIRWAANVIRGGYHRRKPTPTLADVPVSR